MKPQPHIPTKTDTPPIAVWFDLDDTVIDFTANAHEVLCDIWHDEPMISSYFPDIQLWITSYEHHNAQLWKQYSAGEISRDFLRKDRFLHPFTQAAIPRHKAEPLARRLDVEYLDRLALKTNMIPGAVHLLRLLSSMPHISIGCLSNGFEEVQYRKIHNCKLEELFDTVVLSDQVGYNKPHPLIFDAAMQTIGVEDSTRNIMIGDNPDTDIAGAIRAGWHAIWFDAKHTEDSTTHPNTVRVHSMTQVQEELLKLLTNISSKTQ